MTIKFSFIYPVTQRRIDLSRSKGVRFDHVADLVVSGYAEKRCNPALEGMEECYEFEINQILFEEKDIFPLIEALDAKDDIEEACFHHIHHVFTNQASDYEIPRHHSHLAKVVSMPLKLKAK